jgi:hypothetical protein
MSAVTLIELEAQFQIQIFIAGDGVYRVIMARWRAFEGSRG